MSTNDGQGLRHVLHHTLMSTKTMFRSRDLCTQLAAPACRHTSAHRSSNLVLVAERPSWQRCRHTVMSTDDDQKQRPVHMDCCICLHTHIRAHRSGDLVLVAEHPIWQRVFSAQCQQRSRCQKQACITQMLLLTGSKHEAVTMAPKLSCFTLPNIPL
jgi:hypothetical protein